MAERLIAAVLKTAKGKTFVGSNPTPSAKLGMQVKVLVACEFSGVVRDAFVRSGHYAMSCDLLPTETPGNHYHGDIRDLLASNNEWDLMIAHPPCTHLSTIAGAMVDFPPVFIEILEEISE